MNYVILDSNANLVDSYDHESEALDALTGIVNDDPAAAEDFALFTYDDDGAIAADAVLGSDVLHKAQLA